MVYLSNYVGVVEITRPAQVGECGLSHAVVDAFARPLSWWFIEGLC